MALLLSVLEPTLGLLFWPSIIFLFVWFLILRYAGPMIKNTLKERSQKIDEQLHAAEKAREKMQAIKDEHARLAEEAKKERVRIREEAELLYAKIIKEAEEKSQSSRAKLLESAEEEIENRQKEMEKDMFNKAGRMAVLVAEQIMKRELEGQQEAFVGARVEQFKARAQSN